jgi:hypothetical protein
MAGTGEVLPQKWTHFYAAVLSKLAAGRGQKLKPTVGAALEGGISKQRIDAAKGALHEPGPPMTSLPNEPKPLSRHE